MFVSAKVESVCPSRIQLWEVGMELKSHLWTVGSQAESTLDGCGVSRMDGHSYVMGGSDFLPGISTQLSPIDQPVFIGKCRQCMRATLTVSVAAPQLSLFLEKMRFFLFHAVVQTLK